MIRLVRRWILNRRLRKAAVRSKRDNLLSQADLDRWSQYLANRKANNEP